MTTNQGRSAFRESCLGRDSGTCVVPWCGRDADDVHHIIERAEWKNGGYFQDNGASVCNMHHRYAEKNAIPPQAFWSWIGLNPVTPSDMDTNVSKWGDSFETYEGHPPLTGGRQLPFSPSWDGVGDHDELSQFVSLPLVAIPVQTTPLTTERITDDAIHTVAPPFTLYKQDTTVLGAYQPDYELWLSWDDTVRLAESLGLDTPTPLVATTDDAEPPFEAEYELYDDLREKLTGVQHAIVRSRFPMHVGQVDSLTAKWAAVQTSS